MNLPVGTSPLFWAALGGLVIISALVSSSPANAHAIIDLNGVAAVAGKTSGLTLEIQHGCLTGQDGTTQVTAFAGKPWGAIKPAAVIGWTSVSARLANGGQQITWTIQGDPQPFGRPVFFPLTVNWPKSAGIYGLRVLQVCPSGVTWWDTPVSPATATAPSPPLTPLPQVQVLARPGSTAGSAGSTNAQTTADDPNSGAAHSGH